MLDISQLRGGSPITRLRLTAAVYSTTTRIGDPGPAKTLTPQLTVSRIASMRVGAVYVHLPAS